MLNIIDISSWQKDIVLEDVFHYKGVDGCIVKATEDVNYVNPYFEKWVRQLEKLNKPFGFYHFAQYWGSRSNLDDATSQANYFIDKCKNWFGKGIPILDWEVNCNVEWVNRFVNIVHSETGIWPWIYANPWRFDLGNVEPNCGRWIASYPNVAHPTFSQAAQWDTPECDGLVCAWQFCSDGIVKGYHGELDCSIFYGDLKAWNRYAGKTVAEDDTIINANVTSLSNANYSVILTDRKNGKAKQVIENDGYKLTIERK